MCLLISSAILKFTCCKLSSTLPLCPHVDGAVEAPKVKALLQGDMSLEAGEVQKQDVFSQAAVIYRPVLMKVGTLDKVVFTSGLRGDCKWEGFYQDTIQTKSQMDATDTGPEARVPRRMMCNNSGHLSPRTTR